MNEAEKFLKRQKETKKNEIAQDRYEPTATQEYHQTKTSLNTRVEPEIKQTASERPTLPIHSSPWSLSRKGALTIIAVIVLAVTLLGISAVILEYKRYSLYVQRGNKFLTEYREEIKRGKPEGIGGISYLDFAEESFEAARRFPLVFNKSSADRGNAEVKRLRSESNR